MHPVQKEELTIRAALPDESLWNALRVFLTA
jgi:hypothetical protein